MVAPPNMSNKPLPWLAIGVGSKPIGIHVAMFFFFRPQPIRMQGTCRFSQFSEAELGYKLSENCVGVLHLNYIYLKE